jgi:hypothetical protein
MIRVSCVIVVWLVGGLLADLDSHHVSFSFTFISLTFFVPSQNYHNYYSYLFSSSSDGLYDIMFDFHFVRSEIEGFSLLYSQFQSNIIIVIYVLILTHSHSPHSHFHSHSHSHSQHLTSNFVQYEVGEKVHLWMNRVGPFRNPQEVYK